MTSWTWALLLKPVAGLFVLAGFLAIVGVAVLLTKLLRPLFPESRLKAWLFREHRSGVGDGPARATDRVNDDLPVVRWNAPKD